MLTSWARAEAAHCCYGSAHEPFVKQNSEPQPPQGGPWFCIVTSKHTCPSASSAKEEHSKGINMAVNENLTGRIQIFFLKFKNNNDNNNNR